MRPMTALALIAVAAAVGVSGVAPATSGEYVARTKNCSGSVEKWVKEQAGGGKKILEERGRMGAFAAYLVRWNDGSVQEVTIGPASDLGGNPAICILAQRHISNPGQT